MTQIKAPAERAKEQPCQPMPVSTINDVARLAGVSIKTVSRVMNNEPNVREETRTKVKEAAARLHYRPEPAGAIPGRRAQFSGRPAL